MQNNWEISSQNFNDSLINYIRKFLINFWKINEVLNLKYFVCELNASTCLRVTCSWIFCRLFVCQSFKKHIKCQVSCKEMVGFLGSVRWLWGFISIMQLRGKFRLQRATLSNRYRARRAWITGDILREFGR